MADRNSGRSEPPDALRGLADDFLSHCRAKGLSPRTWKDAYRFALQEVFLPWCAEKGVTQSSQLNQRVLDRFVNHLRDDGGRRGQLSEGSIGSYSRSVRAFLGWATAEGELSTAVRVPTRTQKRRVLDVLSREEIQAMEDAARSERDKLLVRVLADTGLRLGELLHLRGADILVGTGRAQLKVRGKGDQERLVPIPPLLARRLQRYLRGRRAEPEERMFAAIRRGPDGRYAPLTENGAEQAVRALGIAAGIERRVYPHLFRHSYATHALRKGMSVVQLQQILGHSSLAMISQVYAHLTTDDAYDAAMRVLLREER